MMKPSPLSQACVAFVALLVSGCPSTRGPGGTLPLDDVPPPLLPVAAFDGDFMLEQRVTARYRDREDGFDAVLQKRGDALTLVGLGPMGAVGFVVNVTDAGVTLENNSGHEVPFQPAHIVADVQRVFYPWLEGEAPTDGTRAGDVLSMHVVERFEGGRLVERRFTRTDVEGSGDIVVAYAGETLDAGVRTRVLLTNGWYGYELEIETFTATVPEGE